MWATFYCGQFVRGGKRGGGEGGIGRQCYLLECTVSGFINWTQCLDHSGFYEISGNLNKNIKYQIYKEKKKGIGKVGNMNILGSGKGEIIVRKKIILYQLLLSFSVQSENLIPFFPEIFLCNIVDRSEIMTFLAHGIKDIIGWNARFLEVTS